MVDCGSLSASGTGGISVQTTSGTTYNKVATYTCTVIGYELVGTSQRVCQENGAWSGSAPYCRRKTIYASAHYKLAYCSPFLCLLTVIDCGVPDLPLDPTALVVSYTTTTYASIATYSCNIGYNFFGVTSRTCLETYSWSGSPPYCQSKVQM